MKQIEASGIQVVAISYDSVDILKSFATKNEIEFALLSDPGSHVIKSFGLLNETAGKGRYGGIAHPLTVMVDANRKVVGRISATVRLRHTAQQLIDKWQDVGSP